MEYEEEDCNHNFYRKVFVGPEALRGGFKSSPMLRGVDRDVVKEGIRNIEILIDR